MYMHVYVCVYISLFLFLYLPLSLREKCRKYPLGLSVDGRSWWWGQCGWYADYM